MYTMQNTADIFVFHYKYPVLQHAFANETYFFSGDAGLKGEPG